jgi:ComF family protein
MARAWPARLGALLFPGVDGCPLCGAAQPDLGPSLPCGRCRAMAEGFGSGMSEGRGRSGHCHICGRHRWDVSLGRCGECAATPPPFKSARSAAPYEGAVRLALRRLKYSGAASLAGPLADLTAPVLAREGWLAAGGLVPVPLHPRRLRSRGYNQAELLAGELGWRFGLPVLATALARVRNTPPQARAGRAGRLAAMAGAFAGDPSVCRGRRLVLVDDVFTTGSTAAGAAGALLAAGAAAVVVLTVAAGR